MRPQKVSVAKAEAYYYGRDPLYAPSESVYVGQGAKNLGLEGQALGEEFTLLIRGFSPDGDKLAQKKNLSADKAVAGTDIPFTVPKSWSVLALMDPALLRANIEAAQETMRWIEAQGWIRGRETLDGVTREVAGKMIGMVAPHSTSRENDAHIHAHGFIANIVERPDGTHCTLENHAIFEHSKEIRQYHLAAFAAKKAVQKYGIVCSVDRGGTVIPEAAGVSDEVRDLFSKRHNEIGNSDAMRERLKAKMPHLNADDIDELVQLGTRKTKNKDLTKEDLIHSHQKQLQAAGLPSLEQMRDQSLQLKAVQGKSADKLSSIEYVRQAAEDLTEHQSVFNRADLFQGAIKQSLGRVAPSDIDKAILEAVVKSELVAYAGDKFTTREIHRIESRIATVAVQQRAVFEPLLGDSQVQEVVRQFEVKKGFNLTRGQAEAVGYAFQHAGRIGVIQGDAGSGKSSSMEAVADTIRDIGREAGIVVRGFALQGKTSVLLEGDSGISSGTIDSFLNSKSTWDGASRQLWVVDEYSMVDSRRLAGLVGRAEAENAQIILLGDKKQLAAIGAGRLGQDLDEHGLVKSVVMDESLRQRTEYAQAIDAAMKRGDIRRALDIMQAAGKLIEIPGRDERAKAMAKAFVEHDQAAKEATGGRRGALAMTLTNAEREAVIDEVRRLQKESGIIGQEDHVFTTRAPVQLDAVTRKLAASYKPGMIVIASKDRGELEAGKEARIVSVDTLRNTITLAAGDKAEIIDARSGKGLMVYEERETPFSVGERGVFLKSDNTQQGRFNKLKNGVGFTVESIEGGQLTVKTDFGNVATLKGEGAYVANAQAITGHKAQGATEHTGLLSISSEDRLATRNMLYVLTTRQSHELVAFVDDKEKLIEALKAETKTSSLEEQRELLQSLAEQLKATIGRDNALEAGNGRSMDRQRLAEMENQAADTDSHSQQQAVVQQPEQPMVMSMD